jgi:hypothetical protein
MWYEPYLWEIESSIWRFWDFLWWDVVYYIQDLFN